MDRFELKIKKSQPQIKPKANLADLVMQKISKSQTASLINWLLVSFLAICCLFLLHSLAINDDLHQLLLMLINDFDIVMSYPTEFLAALSQNLPWFNLISTLGIGIMMVWYFKSLKRYVD